MVRGVLFAGEPVLSKGTGFVFLCIFYAPGIFTGRGEGPGGGPPWALGLVFPYFPKKRVGAEKKGGNGGGFLF